MRYTEEIYRLLYTDDTGEVVGLDEVQLMKGELSGRTKDLISLLQSKDLYLAYQSGLILCAWGINEGVSFFDYFIDNRFDKITEFEPHRIWDQDNVYDVIAEALEISFLVNKYDREIVRELLEKLLMLYGDCFFESKLKTALLNVAMSSLAPAIKQAIQAALDQKRYYQASQLLPVIVQYDKPYAAQQLSLFRSLTAQDERISYNIAETQTYL